jgi:hypothetical protein
MLLEMAETDPKPNVKAAAERKPDAEKPVEEVQYEVDYLVRNSRALLSVEGSFARGALSETTRKRLSLAEAAELIKTYGDRTVAVDGNKE